MADLTLRSLDPNDPPLTFEQANNNFLFVQEQALAAQQSALDAQGHAQDAQNSAQDAQDVVDGLGFELSDISNRIRNLQYNDGPYPSLDLQFVGARMVDPRLVVERPGEAWGYNEAGVLVPFAANEPRLTYDPATGKSLGLLVEGQGTNLLARSEDFANAVWSKSQSTVVPAAATSPRGTTGASKLVEGVGSSIFQLSTFVTVGTSSTFSLYAKAGERNQVCLHSFEGTTPSNPIVATFDLLSGEVVYKLGATDAKIEDCGRGWFRCSASSPTAAVSTSWNIRLANGSTPSSNGTTYVGDGSSGLYIWGAQLETGTYATSYISTGGSQVTRATDNAYMPTADWYNASQGTLLVAASAQNIAGVEQTVAMFSDGVNTTEQIRVFIDTTGKVRFRYRAGASDIFYPTYELPQTIILAATWGNGRAASCLNGGIVTSASTLALPSVNRINIGAFFTGAAPLNGTISRLAYFPRVLSDAQLIALTEVA